MKPQKDKMMKTKFIAEVGSNHNQDLTRCFNFIETAKELGCWGIKFQMFYADKLWTKAETIAKMTHWELSSAFIPSIAKYCKDVDIKFGCSVFHRPFISFLNNYVDFFKIGSYEILCVDLIKDCYDTGKPLFISTGLARWPRDIRAIINHIDQDNLENISWLHCNSNYPAFPENCNLANIRKQIDNFRESIGWSDHTKQPGVIYQAIANGAEVIEFHLDLDEKGHEYEIGHCWLPNEIKEVIKTVKIMEQSQGSYESKPDPKLLVKRTNPETMKRNC